MTTYALGFQDIDRSAGPAVGGKGANLGELARIDGLQVPAGFCVTTDAFRDVTSGHGELDGLLHALSRLDAAARTAIGDASARIRRLIEDAPVPPAVVRAITEHLAALGADHAYAVRSSATAEDLPTASFAGQQDTYLNVIGAANILAHVRRCWASLFTDRAVTYRLQSGIDHRRVQMAVVIQRMVFPQVAGVLFTADPVTGNRTVSSIDASFGLGEALVSGLVNADTYRVRDGAIIDRTISSKTLAIVPITGGGTRERAIEPDRQGEPALTDAQIARLEQLGRRIEAHLGGPQDIEWCLADGELFVVQSRPITTLYPVPDAGDQAPHVYLSVGHQQMMTDAIRPLGLSFWLMTTPAPMRTAGGRLFFDVAPMLASPARAAIVARFGQWDPLTSGALATILDRGFVPPAPPSDTPAPPPGVFGPPPPIENDPAIVRGLVARSQASIAELQRAIATIAGPALFDFIVQDLVELRNHLTSPQSSAVIRAGMDAAEWLNAHVQQWLGDSNVADTLSQSVPNNPTSEMGLALLDVADVVRQYPAVVAYLPHADDATFFEGLAPLEGGPDAVSAFAAFLTRYGMRCAGEIDVTRTRWAEAPTTLVPLILGNVTMFAPGESRRRFEHGRQAALAKEQDVLARLRQLPDGASKADEAQQKISVLRNFVGHREYPKFGMVQRYFEYRKALLREAGRLQQGGVIREAGDIYFLSFAELREVVRTGTLDPRIVDERREAHRFHEKLTPPRVMTSEGEVITASYRRENLPPGALVGLPVSTGVIEGRARVVTRMEDAALEDGDILVTTFTDPSWTPLFVSIKGLVTEVGGLMTHGAVIAREYGLPAVVGIDGATRRIADGQRIRVDGTSGTVELLAPSARE
jgi:phosphoenolpyruvate synthase/pyruvate phosphate dikinase